MEDDKILELFWSRCEQAVSEVSRKYGTYCRGISMQIVGSAEDAEECVNDTWLHAWNSIPPARPVVLKSYLGRITRNLSINRWRKDTAEKRGGGETEVLLGELEDCLQSRGTVEGEIEMQELSRHISEFLRTLPADKRYLFVRRYWYGDSVSQLAEKTHSGESCVKTTLFRLRRQLKKYLEKEGIQL